MNDFTGVEMISIKIKVKKSIHIPSINGSEIVIERVKWGSSFCWHLHHGKKRLITQSKQKIHRYIQENRINQNSYEIVDLGEY